MPDLDELSKMMDTIRIFTGAFRDSTAEKREKEEERLGESYRENLRRRAWSMRLIWRLPRGWEFCIQQDGRPCFVDHNTKSTSWNKPPLARDGDMEDAGEDGST